MDIFDFRCFVELATAQHYSNAADNLHIAESSLSRRIRKMEDELQGVKLIDRSTRKVVLTECGVAFLPYAQQILNAYSEMEAVVANYHPGNDKMLNFGTIRTSAIPALNSKLLEYVKEDLSLKLRIVEDGTHNLVDGLNRKQYDLILFVDTNKKVFTEEITEYPLIKEEVFLVMNKQHPFAKKKVVDFRTLVDEKFAMFTNSSSMKTIFTEYCKKEQVHPRIVQESGPYDVQLEFVRENLGIALMTKNLASNYRYIDELALVSLADPLMRQISLAVQNSSLRRESVRTLINKLRRDFGDNNGDNE